MRRKTLARFFAPAAFLLAVTVAVLLVRSGLDGGGGSTTTTATAPPATTAATTTAPATTAPTRTATGPTGTEVPPAARRFYVIRSGDTFELIAIRFDTTVDELRILNPAVEPTSLQPGQRIRIR